TPRRFAPQAKLRPRRCFYAFCFAYFFHKPLLPRPGSSSQRSGKACAASLETRGWPSSFVSINRTGVISMRHFRTAHPTSNYAVKPQPCRVPASTVVDRLDGTMRHPKDPFRARLFRFHAARQVELLLEIDLLRRGTRFATATPRRCPRHPTLC